MFTYMQQGMASICLLTLLWFGSGYATASNSMQAYGGLDHIENAKLIFANVIYRHGDRMPIKPYATDPWKDVENWPTGFGQLTNLGKQQHYELGKWLRKRYDSVLLSSNYTNQEIYIQSTDIDRTLMSALSNLAGLYPPIEQQIWNDNVSWQPIPVHTIPEHLDAVLAAKAPCPALGYELTQLSQSAEFKQMNEKYAYLYNYLSKYAGQKIHSMEDVQRINNTFFIETLYNRTLPDWTRQVYPSTDMTFISAFQFAVNTYTRKMARLNTGLLIKEMLQRFQQKSLKTLNPDRNVWVYSAHDTTIASVLNTLKVFDIHSPPYTACILFELYLDENSKPFVSLSYKNTSSEPLQMKLPGCGKYCPLKNMFKLYEDILPVDHAEECKLSPMEINYEDANLGMAMSMLATIIGALLFLACALLCYFRRWNIRSTYSTYSEVA